MTLFGTGQINPGANFELIPGLTTTISVPANAVIVLDADGGIQTTSASTTGFSRVDVALAIDGSIVPNGGFRRVIAANTGGTTTAIENYSLGLSATLPAGNHTFAVFAALQSGSAANVGGNNTSVLQGRITVQILKQ